MKIKSLIIIFFAFNSQIFGQSVTLLPNSLSSAKSSNNLLESTNENILTLKRSTSGIYSALYFRNFQNTYLGGLFLGLNGAIIEADNPNGIGFNVSGSTVLQVTPSWVITYGLLRNYGTISSSELEFSANTTTERRQVFADKDGVLRSENSSNQYASYNFTAIQAQDYDDQLRKGSGFAWFNTTTTPATMYLPVNLPNGVKITNVRMFIKDDSASNLSFTLNRNSHLSNTFTTIATATSASQIGTIFSLNDSANETVDNQNNSYYVNISSVGNWTGNTLQFHSLVITYQYQ
jgi:hypothetical protein